MASVKSIIIWLFGLLIISALGIFVVSNYSYVFAARIEGEVVEVERVMNPTAILGRATDAQIHSYAVLLKGDNGKLYAASGDDRQWQVIKKGCRIKSILYVYPPWNLEKSGTYFNARVKEVLSCPTPEAQPQTPEAK